jgi:glutamate 5-kinase
MVTKVAAARICMSAGCATLIANGHQHAPLSAILNGGECTWFLASGTPLAARKQWIAGALEPRGRLQIDAGALAALAAGRSLLAVGVIAVSGEFQRGDAVEIMGDDGRAVARGLAAYSSSETRAIMGARSDQYEALLGYRGRSAVIHRDNLVLMEPNST